MDFKSKEKAMVAFLDKGKAFVVSPGQGKARVVFIVTFRIEG